MFLLELDDIVFINRVRHESDLIFLYFKSPINVISNPRYITFIIIIIIKFFSQLMKMIYGCDQKKSLEYWMLCTPQHRIVLLRCLDVLKTLVEKRYGRLFTVF